MPCNYPINGWRSKKQNKNGKFPFTTRGELANYNEELQVPCGQCTGCKIDYSRKWALRLCHELQFHTHASFITLTYNNESLPPDLSLEDGQEGRPDAISLFFKRLRRHYDRHNIKRPIKYYACGEYGDSTNRPHYHAIIFGEDFSEDRELWRTTKHGHLIYRSTLLEKLWGKYSRTRDDRYGNCEIGEVNWNTCAYTARYVMKKRRGNTDMLNPETGQPYKDDYLRQNPKTGDWHYVGKEFSRMSNGLGKDWVTTFTADTDKDYVTHGGKTFGLPAYYDKILETDFHYDQSQVNDKRSMLGKSYPANNHVNAYKKQLMLDRKEARKENALKHKEDNTAVRREAKEKCLKHKTNQLLRETL